jgi:O-antigen ligase
MHSVRSATAAPTARSLLLPCVFLAPTLVAFNVPPETTLLNQVLVLLGWGAVLMVQGGEASNLWQFRSAWPLWLALALLCAAVGASWLQHLPSSLALQALGWFAAAASLVVCASQSADGPLQNPWRHALDDRQQLADAMLLAAIPSALIALIQVFAPQATDGAFLVTPHLPGRAEGNFRQPNHLALMLLWGIVAWVPVAQVGRWFHRRLVWQVALAVAALLVFALVLSASRTGTVGILMLAAWGVCDRRLSRRVRLTLLAMPVAYALFWVLMIVWAQETSHVFGAQSRLESTSLANVSSSRFSLWGNVLDLIAVNPWFGVGYHELNLAWTLTPFEGRHASFLDNAHNLPLQLTVELGVPCATLVLSLLLLAFGWAARRCWRDGGESGPAAKACVMMLSMVGLHSLLEYPLWYGYFLLPTAWIWGLALRVPSACDSDAPFSRLQPRLVFAALGALFVIGGLWAQKEYRSLSLIYLPSDSASLQERIETSKSSVLFRHYALKAEATSSEVPSSAIEAFKAASHALLDVPLMTAWAQALSETGQRDKASYLAERIKEFRLPEAQAFFDVCNQVTVRVGPPPFQCVPSKEPHTWRDFLD